MADPAYARVRERDGHRCQFPLRFDRRGNPVKCGQAYRTEVHHRMKRSQGGDETEENLITLCKAHHDWTDFNVDQARELGLLVHTGDDPARHPWMDVPIPEDGYDRDEFDTHDPGDYPC